ncbi:MAG: class B sortase [Oscillospiraceae bacterium]|nr:class B sortase [Oscillospiraceae bacterium]
MSAKTKLMAALAAVLAGVFLYSGWVLVNYRLDSRRQQQEHEQLRQLLETPAAQSPETEQPLQGDSLPTYVTVTHPETGEERQVLGKYASLYERNDDFVGWIAIEGTRVDYPVLQSDGKDYYLRRGFDRKRANHGSIYVWEQANVFAPSDHVTLFGHRMNDGTMFYDLLNYAKQDFWQAHPRFRFDTLEGEQEYEIFAAFRTSGSGGEGVDYHTFVDADSPEAFDAFVSQCLALSFYDTGIVPQYGDKLVTLSTCDYALENGRMAVMGRRLEPEG